MRACPRCSECDSEDAKIVSLRSPAGEHYCGRACLREGQKNFIRLMQQTIAEAVS
ncbi:hypothetical protein V1289_004047 [Bradyrhizobium sp. AZCC 2289]